MRERFPKEHFNEEVHPDATPNYIWMKGHIAETRAIVGGAKLIRIFNFAAGTVSGHVERGKYTDFIGVIPMSTVNQKDVEGAKNELKKQNKWQDEWEKPPKP